MCNGRSHIPVNLDGHNYEFWKIKYIHETTNFHNSNRKQLQTEFLFCKKQKLKENIICLMMMGDLENRTSSFTFSIFTEWIIIINFCGRFNWIRFSVFPGRWACNMIIRIQGLKRYKMACRTIIVNIDPVGWVGSMKSDFILAGY